MTPQEIEELQKEVILLRMRNQRLEGEIKKYQNLIKDILIGEISTELANENPEDVVVENAETASEHTENPA
jgi:hypothetical protein